MPKKKKPIVSIIIPTKNEEKNIERCVTNFKRQAYENLEIIVIDNASNDRTVKIAKKIGVSVFQAKPERSAQRNFGAQKALGNLLFFVDADMEVERKVISQAVRIFEKDPKVKAIIIPEISAGENYWGRVRALERSCYLNEPIIEAARIFNKRAFWKAGGFDKKLIAGEDWDLSKRIKKLGKIGRTKAKIIHHEDILSLMSHLKKNYYYATNIYLYAKKHPERYKTQSGIARIMIFVKNWRKLVSDPIHGIGVIILKSLEYLMFLLAKLK